MSETLVQALGSFADDVFTRGVAAEVARDVEGRIIDIVGNALAAVGDGPGEAALGYATDVGGHPQAQTLGYATRLPMSMAALVNGTLAHSLDFDDTHLPSVLHPSASVVPAALAVAEHVGATGSQLLAAVAVGDEICVRLGMASYDPGIRNSIFFENGLHATSICGALACAAAAAVLLGLGRQGAADAMGVAASMGAGLIEANRTGGTVKRLHCGWAAHAGISAAQMVAHGITGPPTVLEGRFGFFRAYSEGRFDAGVITGDLGERWELARVFYKPYPTNHFTHAGIDAALAIRDGGVSPAEVESIRLGLPAPVMRTVAEPADEKARPESGYHAKFSGPFTVAAALLGGGGLGVTMDDFTDANVRDPSYLDLASKVTCYVDDEATEVFPHQFPGVLEVTTRRGEVVSHRVRHNRGGPENPLTPDELALKFSINARRLWPEDRATGFVEKVRSLVSAPSVHSLLDE